MHHFPAWTLQDYKLEISLHCLLVFMQQKQTIAAHHETMQWFKARTVPCFRTIQWALRSPVPYWGLDIAAEGGT